MSPKKVDRNQAEMVAALRKAGLHVTDLHVVGQGVPDIIATGYHREVDRVLALLVEIKADRGRLSPSEVKWHSNYPDDGPLLIAYRAEDVLAWFSMIETG